MVALDRQDRGRGELSAIQEVEHSLGVGVESIVGMNDIIDYLKVGKGRDRELAAMEAYRHQYGTE
jgi:orotate phosphoribosyltransferase